MASSTDKKYTSNGNKYRQSTNQEAEKYKGKLKIIQF